MPAAKKKMNALDAAIMGKKKLPSKNKMYPGDSDTTKTPSKGKPIIRPNVKPAPLPKGPKSPAPGKRVVATKKPGKKK